jgi:7,8-dihydropterin-6-yl-methyl-4-(beta-D-ribofuranosyl)aminobenzene 5'-phosphate synthase
MVIIYILFAIAILVVVILLKKTIQVNAGRRKAEQEYAGMSCKKLSPTGNVKTLSIMPVVDYYADKPDLKTEPGVSYFIAADDTKILMDVGLNAKKEHPSPLIHNMEKLGVSPADLDMIFISHLHLDHVGGMKEQREKTFSLSQGTMALPSIPVYAPASLSASTWNPGPLTTIVKEPLVLKPGIASIGVIPRYLFLMGHTLEHSLAIHVEGKGIVLIIGCGHQTIEKIIQRAQKIFDEPIYAIIGGLHYPIHDGRIKIGPLNLQRIVGSDRPPWSGLDEKDVNQAIAAIKRVSPKLVALSPHDSSDWALDRFRQAFGNACMDIKVGKEIRI